MFCDQPQTAQVASTARLSSVSRADSAFSTDAAIASLRRKRHSVAAIRLQHSFDTSSNAETPILHSRFSSSVLSGNLAVGPMDKADASATRTKAAAQSHSESLKVRCRAPRHGVAAPRIVLMMAEVRYRNAGAEGVHTYAPARQRAIDDAFGKNTGREGPTTIHRPEEIQRCWQHLCL